MTEEQKKIIKQWKNWDSRNNHKFRDREMKLVGQRVREERERKENSVTIMSTTKKCKCSDS